MGAWKRVLGPSTLNAALHDCPQRETYVLGYVLHGKHERGVHEAPSYPFYTQIAVGHGRCNRQLGDIGMDVVLSMEPIEFALPKGGGGADRIEGGLRYQLRELVSFRIDPVKETSCMTLK